MVRVRSAKGRSFHVSALALLLPPRAEGKIAKEPQIATGPDGASVDCPCMPAPSDMLQEFEGIVAGMPGIPANTSLGGACFAWDLSGDFSAECRQLSPPSWCVRAWCFVDRSACNSRRPVAESELVRGLWYSYAACGALPPHAVETLANEEAIYVHTFGFPISSDVVGAWAGHTASLRFVMKVFESLDVSSDMLHFREISNSSLKAQEDEGEWTACVHDTVVGNLDICIGDFWSTEERLGMGAHFTGSVFSESVYLYVVTEPEETMVEILLKPLEPFSGGLWAVIVGVMLFSGLAFAFFERRTIFSESAAPASVSNAVYESWKTFLGGGSLEPETRSGKIFAIGFAMFIVITTASFTASTATFLLSASYRSQVTNLKEAINAGLKIGVDPAMRSSITSVFPDFDAVATSWVETSADLIQCVQRQHCDAALLPDTLAHDYHSAGEACEIQPVGPVVMSFPVGYFANSRIFSRIASAVAKLREDGTWLQIQQEVFLPSLCNVDDNSAGPDKLQPQHMLGTVLILLLFFAIAVLVRVLERMESTRAAKKLEKAVLEELHTVGEAVGKSLSAHETGAARASGTTTSSAEPAGQAEAGPPRSGEAAAEPAEACSRLMPPEERAAVQAWREQMRQERRAMAEEWREQMHQERRAMVEAVRAEVRAQLTGSGGAGGEP